MSIDVDLPPEGLAPLPAFGGGGLVRAADPAPSGKTEVSIGPGTVLVAILAGFTFAVGSGLGAEFVRRLLHRR